MRHGTLASLIFGTNSSWRERDAFGTLAFRVLTQYTGSDERET